MTKTLIALALCLVAGTANAQYRGAFDMNMPPSMLPPPTSPMSSPMYDYQADINRMKVEFDRKLDEQRRSLQLQMDNQPRFGFSPYSPPIMR